MIAKAMKLRIATISTIAFIGTSRQLQSLFGLVAGRCHWTGSGDRTTSGAVGAPDAAGARVAPEAVGDIGFKVPVTSPAGIVGFCGSVAFAAVFCLAASRST